jgi:hypothetical protein
MCCLRQIKPEPGGIKELKDYACGGTNLRKIE